MRKDVLTERDVKEMYREMLDEVYGTVKIAGYEYETSRVLEDTDPVAFRIGFVDLWSSLLEDGYAEDSDGNLVREEEEEA